jgi:CheY-like chemotaxis protein
MNYWITYNVFEIVILIALLLFLSGLALAVFLSYRLSRLSSAWRVLWYAFLGALIFLPLSRLVEEFIFPDPATAIHPAEWGLRFVSPVLGVVCLNYFLYKLHRLFKKYLGGYIRHKGRRKGRIMVIDNEATIRSLVKEYLAEHGYIVCTASTIKEAEMILIGQTTCLVIVDMSMLLEMPDQGTGFIRRIREMIPPVVYMIITGKASPETARNFMKMGAVDYLQKPFNLSDVLECVRDFCGDPYCPAKREERFRCDDDEDLLVSDK